MMKAVVKSFYFMTFTLLFFSPLKMGLPTSTKPYIVYAVAPPSVDAKTYYIHLLTSVLGSEKAAKKAMGYVYEVIGGFSATLTPHQASLLSGKSGVTLVVESKVLRVDRGSIRNPRNRQPPQSIVP